VQLISQLVIESLDIAVFPGDVWGTAAEGTAPFEFNGRGLAKPNRRILSLAWFAKDIVKSL